MGEDIEVTDNGEYGVATPPDCLYTMGVATCIAVAVVDCGSNQAYLFHAPGIAASALDRELKAMLSDAASGTGPFKITIAGADPSETGTDDDWLHAQDLVADAFPKEHPELNRNKPGGSCNLEVDPSSHTISFN